MKAQVYIVIFSFSIVSLNGQSKNDNKFLNRNCIHFELGGTGGYYSLNYERNIINCNFFKTSGQIGLSLTPGRRNIWIPIGINEQFSINAHHIEIGIAYVAVREVTVVNSEIGSRIWTDIISGRIGYRYQKPDGNFVWRIGFTPFLQRERIGTNYVPNAPFSVFTPWGGVSVGYAFH